MFRQRARLRPRIEINENRPARGGDDCITAVHFQAYGCSGARGQSAELNKIISDLYIPLLGEGGKVRLPGRMPGYTIKLDHPALYMLLNHNLCNSPAAEMAEAGFKLPLRGHFYHVTRLDFMGVTTLHPIAFRRFDGNSSFGILDGNDLSGREGYSRAREKGQKRRPVAQTDGDNRIDDPHTRFFDSPSISSTRPDCPMVRTQSTSYARPSSLSAGIASTSWPSLPSAPRVAFMIAASSRTRPGETICSR